MGSIKANRNDTEWKQTETALTNVIWKQCIIVFQEEKLVSSCWGQLSNTYAESHTEKAVLLEIVMMDWVYRADQWMIGRMGGVHQHRCSETRASSWLKEDTTDLVKPKVKSVSKEW